MTVKEFSEVLNLDDCQVEGIVILGVDDKGHMVEEYFHESDFGYGGECDKYHTVTERLVGEYGDWLIMDDNYVLNGTAVLSVREGKDNG